MSGRPQVHEFSRAFRDASNGGLSTTAQSVVTTIAAHCNTKTGRGYFQGNAKLAEKVGKSVRTVERSLAEAERSGWIVRTRRATFGGTAEWWVQIPGAAPDANASPAEKSVSEKAVPAIVNTENAIAKENVDMGSDEMVIVASAKSAGTSGICSCHTVVGARALGYDGEPMANACGKPEVEVTDMHGVTSWRLS